jgi:hypothetical protein
LIFELCALCFVLCRFVKAQRTKNKEQIEMYRRPKFLEVLHAIREEMSREADYDVDLFAEMVRSGIQPSHGPQRVIRGFRTRAPRAESGNGKPAKHRQRKRSAQ